MRDLSIIIPANSEEFLKNTVEDILAHIEADTEIIVVLDGKWAEPAISQHPRVNVIYLPESIGQRAATNIGVKLSKAKYVMKLDAHCAFDQGFDRKMIEVMTDDMLQVPIMRNLWAFDWKCYHCGWKHYQGNTPEKCGSCGKSDKLRKKTVWIGKERPQSKSYCFDSEPHFQYFQDYIKRPEVKKQIEENKLSESMSIQGSCFMCTREMYNKLNLCDESYGSWGNQGIEVACKVWLSGNRVIINHNTWYAHMFRTNGDWCPDYLRKGGINTTKKKVWDDILQGKLVNQIHSVDWLIEKFIPVADWTEEKIKCLK
jgi:glycosyltransferase involved in cell wall biosynthesis